MTLKRPKKTSIVILLVIALGTLLTYNYVYKSHRDISSEAPLFTIEVNDLYQQFITDQSASNLKYANKTIVIYGVISTLDLENKTLILNEQLSLSGEQIDFSILEKGQSYRFKGRFIGFDDLFGELKMDQSQLID